jgi:hypothetical protein
MEMKCLFSIAPDARKGGKIMGVFLVIGRWLQQHRTLAQRPT